MDLKQALQLLHEEKDILVNDKTFLPITVTELILETGEKITWVEGEGDYWLSIDPISEEVIFFDTLEDEVDIQEDVVFYANQDYELSYEVTGKVYVNEEDFEQVTFRDYEKDDGEILRVAENEMTGEVKIGLGFKVTEADLQEV